MMPKLPGVAGIEYGISSSDVTDENLVGLMVALTALVYEASLASVRICRC
jgi:hypothetical protein